MNIAGAGHSAIIRAVATTVSARQRSLHYISSGQPPLQLAFTGVHLELQPFS